MMNMREFCETVINANLSEEMTSFATAQIEKLNTTNAKAQARKARKNEEENAPIVKAIYELLNPSEYMSATEIASAIGHTTAKTSAVLKKMITEGIVESVNGKELGEGNRKMYTRA